MALMKTVNVLGQDIGNNSTKTSEGICFVSQVSLGEELKSEYSIKVKWNDNFYIIGEDKLATRFTGTDKIDTDEYAICLLASAALSYMDQNYINLIPSIGLPNSKYENAEVRERYRDKIKSLKEQTITLYFDRDDKVGITKTINIVDCQVNAEGNLRELLNQEVEKVKYPMLVVDFGGGTLDVTKYNLTNDYKDGKQVKVIKAERFTESKLGFDNILDSIRKDLDAKGYALELNQDLLAILNEKELFTMNGNINFEALKSKTLKPYIATVKRYLIERGLMVTPTVYFAGGCAEFILNEYKKANDIIAKNISTTDDSQFMNALNFEREAIKNLDTKKYKLNN